MSSSDLGLGEDGVFKVEDMGKEKRAAIEAMTNTALAPGGPLVPPPHPRQRVYHSTEPAFIS